MAQRKLWPTGWRGIVLILLGIWIGATLITPAVAHVGGTLNHLWSAPNHIRAKVKTYGDNRWLGKTAKAADAELLDGVDSSALLRDDAGVYTSASASDSTSPKFQPVSCPVGLIVLGGGGVINPSGSVPPEVVLTASHPAGFGAGTPGNAWWVRAQETAATSANWGISTYAICATPG